ncbi:MAG: DUF998 domain-containing protein [Pseudomonadota bacterium]
MPSYRITALLGLAGVGAFASALLLFSFLNPNFHPTQDYVSKLGALGQPFAVWWNVVGFGLVGLMLAAFGWVYGKLVRDRLIGFLLALFGLGFAATAIPIDLGSADAAVSKAHVVAICLGLAGWCFGLARLASLTALSKSVRRSAKLAATLVVAPMVGQALELWPMPVTHRLVFAVVFGWFALTSITLLRSGGQTQAVA